MQPLFSYQRRILLGLMIIILAGLLLKIFDRQRQLIGFDIKGFLDGYNYTTAVDTSDKEVNLSTNAVSLANENDSSLSEFAFNKLKINVNSANELELEKLPGIGPVLAKRIVDYRGKSGAFKTAKDLLKVNGIGENKLAKIKENIEF